MIDTRFIWILQALFAMIAGLLILTGKIMLSPYVAIPLGFVLLFYLPGKGVVRITGLETDGFPGDVPAAAVLSFGVLTLTGLPAFLIHMDIKTYAGLNIIAGAIIYMLSLTVKRQGRERGKPDIAFMAVLFMSVLTVAVVFLLKTGVTPDVLVSFADIRKLAETEAIANMDTAYRELETASGYNFNILYLALAALVALTGHDAIRVILLLPVLLSPVMIGSVYLFSRTLFKNRRAACFSVMFFLLIFGPPEDFEIFRTSFFQLAVTGFILAPIGFTMTLRYLDEGEKTHLFAAAFTALISAAFHPFGFIAYLSGLIFYLLWLSVFRYGDRNCLKRLLAVIGLCILLTLPYIALQISHFSVDHVSDAAYTPWRPVRLTENLFVVNPDVLFAPHYHVKPPFAPRPHYAVIYLLGLVLMFFVGKKQWVPFLLALTYTPLLIVFNPLLYPVAGRILTFQLARRFTQIAPLYLAAAGLLWLIIGRKERLFERIAALAAALLFLGLALPLADDISGRTVNPGLSLKKLKFEKNPYLPNMMREPDGKLPLIEALKKEPAGSVVAADYDTGMMIVAFLPDYLLVFEPQNVSPAARRQSKRLKAAHIIYNSSDPDKTMEAVKQFGVDYIVLNENSAYDFGDDSRKNKFLSNPDLFEVLYEKSGFTLIKVRP